MSAHTQPRSPGGPLALAVLRVSWALVRFPVVAFMSILEPIVRGILAGFALLVTLTAFFLRFAAPPGLSIPFWTMLATAIGCIALLAVYHAILRVLSA